MDLFHGDTDFRRHTFELPNEELLIADVLVNNAKYVGKKLSTDRRVPGRIGNPEFYNFWKTTLKASDFILNTIRDGYRFPFIDMKQPPSRFTKNNKSFFLNKDFAFSELKRLETLGCIHKVTTRPYLVLPLSVVFSRKLRLVVDASRGLNPYLCKRKIKLEDLSVCEQSLQPNDYQTTQDLDSGYWHVPLHPDYFKYVGVHYVHEDNSISYWQWSVLFLGISDAVWIFTKLLLPHKRYLRSLGVRCSIYIDDQRILGKSHLEAKAHTQIAFQCFEKGGWTINVDKSSAPPSQTIKFLGLINDSRKMKYFVPEDKIVSICDLIVKILSKPKVYIKVLARLLGKLQFCFRALGPCVRLLCRSSFYMIAKSSSWNAMLIISDSARNELLYLKENFVNLNGHCIRPSLSQIKIDVILSSDASELGNCLYEVKENNIILHRRVFTEIEANKSSTFRELTAFHDFYCSPQAKVYKNTNITHYTDSHNCSIILTVGSRNISLQGMVFEIFSAWKILNLNVTVVYISRDDPIIEFADEHSRNFDLSDYSFDFSNFLILSKLFDPLKLIVLHPA